MAAKKTMTLNLSDEEMDSLEQLALRNDMTKTAVIKKAIRIYLILEKRLQKGEHIFVEDKLTRRRSSYCSYESPRARRAAVVSGSGKIVSSLQESLTKEPKTSSKQAVTRSPEFSESIINTIREPLIALDQDLRVVSVSRSFYEVFKVKPKRPWDS